MFIADNWNEYEILDTGFGEKVERWGEYILRRPDPQIIWPWSKDESVRENVHAHYHRSSKGGGSWEYKKKTPQNWKVKYKNLTFKIQPTGFKHTGLFPEQASNWDWMIDKIKNQNGDTEVLNLFAYTGGATVACASAGANVCHVDASKGMVKWASENIEASGLLDKKVRYIVDDCMKFISREIKRNNKYDGIIMDPPSYGRGPKGEIWKLEDNLFEFLDTAMKVLSQKPKFFLLNSYTTGFSPSVLANMIEMTVGKKYKGQITSGELVLPTSTNGIVLPCGIFGRWECK